MEFISTRGKDGPISFETALLNGLARDGGLYLPVSWPRFNLDEIRQMRDLSYSDLAGLIMSRFTDGEIDQVEMTSLARQSYADFTHPDVAPLRPVAENIHILELFHGPTIAFKDYAMQFLSRVFDRALTRQNRTAVILGQQVAIPAQQLLKPSRVVILSMCLFCFPTGACLLCSRSR